MAAPDLRIVRRPKGTARRSLVAASQPIKDPISIFKTQGLSGRRDDWQNESWVLYDAVGEFKFYVSWISSSCSRVPFVASEVDPDTGQPTGSIAEDNAEGQRVAQIVKKIAGGPLGQAQLIRRTTEILKVPGELWTAILVRPEGEKWVALTREEIKPSSRGRSVEIELPDGKKHEFNPANGDGMFRTWNSHARKACEPDSPVRACLDPLREIARTTRKIANADDSRMINGGLLFIPQEASLPSMQQAPVTDKPDSAPPAARPQPASQALQDMIVAVARESADPKSLASLVPIVVAAPGDQLDKIKLIELGKDLTDVAIKTRTDSIARLAMGLDMSPERLLGMSTGNHWTAWAVGDQDVQLHISPVMETICQAIYDNVLRNVLKAEGIDPDKYMLWYDTSGLTVDPDKTDEAKEAFAAGAITAEALVRYYGLADDSMYDFSSLDGWQQWAQDKVSQDPTLMRDLLPLLDKSVQAIDFPEPLPALPPGQAGQPVIDESGADQQDQPNTEGDTGGQAAAAVRGDDHISMAVDLMVTRALELAAKRRVNTKDRQQYARLRVLPVHEWHRYMPPAADADVSELIRGWDVGLDEIAARYGLDPDQVRLVVAREARRKLTRPMVDAEVI